jgi:DNA-binding IclR family transcriptional regulator
MLSCFTVQQPVLGISDLAERLDLTRSTAHQYATTLTDHGYLDQDDNCRYWLGLRVLDLSLAALGQSGLQDLALGEL